MAVKTGPFQKLKEKNNMPFNCAVEENNWEYVGLEEEQINPYKIK